MNWQEKLMKQLDVDQPNWEIDWADQQDLRDHSRFHFQLRDRVANRLFHRIINSAISAGIVMEVKEKSDVNT